MNSHCEPGNLDSCTDVRKQVDPDRLAAVKDFGAEHCIQSSEDLRAIKKEIRSWAKEKNYPLTSWKIFETSGHPAGQSLAFSLLGYDAHLGIVGYTRTKIEVRLSNLMAFDATLRGTWGCLPEHYPAVVELILNGQVKIAPFVERYPMCELNTVFADLHERRLKKRPVMIPDFP